METITGQTVIENGRGKKQFCLDDGNCNGAI